MDLKGRRVLVTGGAVRVGRCICEVLAARGCHVAVHCNQSTVEAAELAAQIRKGGGQAWVLQALLDGEPACEALMAAAVAAAGAMEILINNASVFNKDAFMDADAARLGDNLAINVFVPMYLTRAFARQCSRTRASALPAGKVINLLDRRTAGIEKGMLPYLLSKKMLHEYTRIAALELGPRITVNAVAPGPVLPPPGKGDAYLHDHAGPMVLGCRPRPEDIAAAVVYLLESDAVTGQTLYVDSGQHLL